MQTLNAGVRVTGRADDAPIRFGADRREYVLSSLYFRQESDALYLAAHLAAAHATVGTSLLPKTVLRAVEQSVDAFVVTDPDGRVISSNRAFLDLAQMPTGAQVAGRVAATAGSGARASTSAC